MKLCWCINDLRGAFFYLTQTSTTPVTVTWIMHLGDRLDVDGVGDPGRLTMELGVGVGVGATGVGEEVAGVVVRGAGAVVAGELGRGVAAATGANVGLPCVEGAGLCGSVAGTVPSGKGGGAAGTETYEIASPGPPGVVWAGTRRTAATAPETAAVAAIAIG